LTFAYLSGWRISEILALRWEDVSLDRGTAITRAEDNKGAREERVPIHPVAVEHLRRLIDPGEVYVFPWPVHERILWRDFHEIQKSAGIELTCRKDHVHDEGCVRYGFHDLRRAYATANARQLGGDALQALMRHKSYETTKKYINMASQLDEAVQSVHVPAFLRGEGSNETEFRAEL